MIVRKRVPKGLYATHYSAHMRSTSFRKFTRIMYVIARIAVPPNNGTVLMRFGLPGSSLQ